LFESYCWLTPPSSGTLNFISSSPHHPVRRVFFDPPVWLTTKKRIVPSLPCGLLTACRQPAAGRSISVVNALHPEHAALNLRFFRPGYLLCLRTFIHNRVLRSLNPPLSAHASRRFCPPPSVFPCLSETVIEAPPGGRRPSFSFSSQEFSQKDTSPPGSSHATHFFRTALCPIESCCLRGFHKIVM